jgi:uncharacterized YigZ family protein
MIIKTIDKLSQGEFKSFQSKFIGFLYPTTSISAFKEALLQLKTHHPKASHICYAYRIGFHNEEVRANDDGEPAGSAGKPILNQLYSFQVQNCSLFVVRYYGGTKLGLPGLIEAYKESAILCLKQAQIIEVENEIICELTLEAAKYYDAIKHLKYNNINIIDSSFIDDQYYLKLSIPESKIEWFNRLSQIH